MPRYTQTRVSQLVCLQIFSTNIITIVRQSLDLCHIHSHILAQPNVAANNAKLFVITKSQQHFYTRLSHCHFSFTITLNVLNTNKYILLLLICTRHCTQTWIYIQCQQNDNYMYKQTIKKKWRSRQDTIYLYFVHCIIYFGQKDKVTKHLKYNGKFTVNDSSYYEYYKVIYSSIVV